MLFRMYHCGYFRYKVVHSRRVVQKTAAQRLRA